MWREKLMKWSPTLALYLLWPAIALVVWGEVKPQASEIETIIWDKALHFIAYFGLGGMICVALKGRRRVLAAILGLAVLGGLLEIVQGFTGRDPSFLDEAANILGAICGAAVGWLLIKALGPKTLAVARRD
jgi:VanZ family protein